MDCVRCLHIVGLGGSNKLPYTVDQFNNRVPITAADRQVRLPDGEMVSCCKNHARQYLDILSYVDSGDGVPTEYERMVGEPVRSLTPYQLELIAACDYWGFDVPEHVTRDVWDIAEEMRTKYPNRDTASEDQDQIDVTVWHRVAVWNGREIIK